MKDAGALDYIRQLRGRKQSYAIAYWICLHGGPNPEQGTLKFIEMKAIRTALDRLNKVDAVEKKPTNVVAGATEQRGRHHEKPEPPPTAKNDLHSRSTH